MNDSVLEDLSIDPKRLVARIEALGEVGAIPGTTGCARLALTDDDLAGRDLVVTWMRDLGLDVTIDGIGNVIATMPGFAAGNRPVMTGSHIDTVGTGGKYDGNLGVLAGLEVIETVIAAGLELDRPLAVGFFTNEEGARFQPDMLGSLVYVGGLSLEDALIEKILKAKSLVMNWSGLDGAVKKRWVLEKCAHSLNYILNRARSSKTKTSRSVSSKECRASRGPS